MNSNNYQIVGAVYHCANDTDRQPTGEQIVAVAPEVPALVKRHERTVRFKLSAVIILLAGCVVGLTLDYPLGGMVFLCGVVATTGAIAMASRCSFREYTRNIRHDYLQKLASEGRAVHLSRRHPQDQMLICAAETRPDYWPAVAVRIEADRLRAQVANLRADLLRLVELGELERVNVNAERAAAFHQLDELSQLRGGRSAAVGLSAWRAQQ